MAKQEEIVSKTGFLIYNDGYSNNGKSWSLTGSPKGAYRFRDYDSAYDVEEHLKEKVGSPANITWDSESCQMWAYFPDKESAVDYLEKIEAYFEKALAVI
jgi:hypothetical protein